ncbi:Serine-protein kinase RsbW [Prochlorococcus sp. MIT 0602]|nr:Serine-protein kinase RsbW [Prochlorococcus sp. MIT 0602]KGG17361.1 Serine-protein kinase RsbW [Prochlorococcus sp. MIT 0603]
MGLHEALVNAVVHGNTCDPDKHLRVRRIITPNWLVWQIQDQGKGIELSQRVSSLPSNEDAESGRGLFLIHQCFDDVRWSRRGNRVQIASLRRNAQ